jgi:RNA-directed DNA polymerase
VKVLNSKGIASHTGPESCVTHREVRDEALTGELAGQPLSREIFKLVQGADAVIVAEGNTDRNVSASAWLTLRGLRPWHVGRGARTKRKIKHGKERNLLVDASANLGQQG